MHSSSPAQPCPHAPQCRRLELRLVQDSAHCTRGASQLSPGMQRRLLSSHCNVPGQFSSRSQGKSTTGSQSHEPPTSATANKIVLALKPPEDTASLLPAWVDASRLSISLRVDELLAMLGVQRDDPYQVIQKHILPRHQGGTNDLPNLALACRSCNQEKGRRHDSKRHAELEHLFAGARPGLVYISCFPSRAEMRKYLAQIAWETDAWCAEDPTHLIHFNGERFLGPYG